METMQLWEQVPALDPKGEAGVPVLEYYPAAQKTGEGTVIVCPGGGYCGRAGYEGGAFAAFLNSIGMDAFVCEYRVAPYRFPMSLLDLRRSVRYVRAHAAAYGVDPAKIAVMGSSAGGHLAALASVYTEKLGAGLEGMDALDDVDPMPNATILCYPVIHYPDETGVTHAGSYQNLFGKIVAPLAACYSPDLLVTDRTPPAFLWHTSEDAVVDVRNSYLYAAALRAHGILHELHVFPHGPHGMGLAENAPHVAQWTGLLAAWLRDMGYAQ